MGTLTLSPRLFEDPTVRFDESAAQTLTHPHRTPSPGRGAGPEGGATLEDVIVNAWKQIAVGAAASCPVCHGRLRAVWPDGSRSAAGRCQDCGSHLS